MAAPKSSFLTLSPLPSHAAPCTQLNTLTEYVDDTEDYINIVLDTRRNQLIQIQLVLTAATLCVGLYTLVTGVFGMNLLPDWLLQNEPVFNQVNGLSTMGTCICFSLFIVSSRVPPHFSDFSASPRPPFIFFPCMLPRSSFCFSAMSCNVSFAHTHSSFSCDALVFPFRRSTPGAWGS